MNRIAIEAPFVQTLQLTAAAKAAISVDVLRLDVLHPVISGNKWYRLKGYLADAAENGKKAIVTFGGAYSNHILATAAACNLYGLKSIGIVRGEAPRFFSDTLTDAKNYGMQLIFTSREDYQKKLLAPEINVLFKEEELYVINEGGYGINGRIGASDILNIASTKDYTHLFAAVGTGTTLAGLITAAAPHQQVMGITVLKNNFSVVEGIKALLPNPVKPFSMIYDYHFGGYAKYTSELIHFMNDWYLQTGIPTDFVYTGKLFFAVQHMMEQNKLAHGSKLLVIHSGGLQGNRSLPKGTLIFPSF